MARESDFPVIPLRFAWQVLGGEVSRLHVYSDSGQKLREFDCSFTSRRYGYPLLCMERAELQVRVIVTSSPVTCSSHSTVKKPHYPRG